MLKNSHDEGFSAAVKKYKLAGFLDALKTFGQGQLGAAKNLATNVRGGFGGQFNPELVKGRVPARSREMARGTHRQEALGNLGTLAPSLAIGGLGAAALMGGESPEEKQMQQLRQMMAIQHAG